jgi:AraC-like DNA-binding protein
MVRVQRRTLFAGDFMRIGHVVAHGSTEPGELQQQESNVVVLPVRGIFTKHDGPRRQVTGTASHAVFIAADRPYRLSFPGRIGDECLTLVLPRGFPFDDLHPHTLLPPAALVGRGVLWRALAQAEYDALEVEETSLALLSTVLNAARSTGAGSRRAETAQRRALQVERVKEAVGVDPQRKWTLATLARIAGASAYHLSRVFRQEVGTTIHAYVTRARIAAVMERVLDAEDDLTTIALDSGFASHSHFSARFRALFGVAPSEVRKIVTAPAVAAA